MNIWCTDFTSVLWVLKSGFHQPSQAGGEETLMCKKRQSEKRERSWQSQSFQTCSAHIWSILSLINRSGPMLRCTAANPEEFQHTARLKWAPHTLHFFPPLADCLNDWLTHSLTQTAGDSVYPPEFNIIEAPTLPCSSLKTGNLSVFLFLYHLLSRAHGVNEPFATPANAVWIENTYQL